MAALPPIPIAAAPPPKPPPATPVTPKDEVEDSAEMKEAAEQAEALSDTRHLAAQPCRRARNLWLSAKMAAPHKVRRIARQKINVLRGTLGHRRRSPRPKGPFNGRPPSMKRDATCAVTRRSRTPPRFENTRGSAHAAFPMRVFVCGLHQHIWIQERVEASHRFAAPQPAVLPVLFLSGACHRGQRKRVQPEGPLPRSTCDECMRPSPLRKRSQRETHRCNPTGKTT